MRATRRYWATAALVVALAAGAGVLDRPALLIGAAVIGAWLLARQYTFVTSLAAVMDDLSVVQSAEREWVLAGRPLGVTLTVELARPAELPLTVSGAVPVTAVANGPCEVSIERGQRSATITVEYEWTVAGESEFDPPSVVVRDPNGLFEERVVRGESPTITVEPGRPTIHVGRGGRELERAFGKHKADPVESGLEPQEIREYVPGDDARSIDWNATARYATPHVRTFESEKDWKVVLVVDHRASMNVGRSGARKLDFVKHLALEMVEAARDSRDPLGLYTVGDTGITLALRPEGTTDRYARIRRQLHDLQPTTGVLGQSTDDPVADEGNRITPLFSGPDSTFAAALRPYFEDPAAEFQAIEGLPLLTTIRTHVNRIRGRTQTVILTDDSDRTDVRKAALFARRRGDEVLVVLTPSALFDPDGIHSLESAYDRYDEFERFRRSLAGLERVDAVELGPSDRLSQILETDSPAGRSIAP